VVKFPPKEPTCLVNKLCVNFAYGKFSCFDVVV